jgi:hypothetical protein
MGIQGPSRSSSCSTACATAEQRPIDVLDFAVITNRLSDGQNVPLVERDVHRGPAMTGRTEKYALSGIAEIRPQLVIGCNELRYVKKNGWVSRLPGSRINYHVAPRRCRQENCT